MDKKSFTLLELIIVIIIIGVLASLALPRMFSTIAKAKANEALTALAILDKAILACIEFDRSGGSAQAVARCAFFVNSNDFRALGVNNPETEVGSKFTYMVPQSGGNIFNFVVAKKPWA